MNYKVFAKDDLTTTTWQGGTTTQLYIYPENASYTERNFDFRISTAKVESETSQFTSLPNVHRKLMVLDGSIIINHEGHHSKKLDKFAIDSFEGNWKTSAIGTCTDFNLMSAKNINGSIEVFEIEKNKELPISKNKLSKWLVLYVFTGEINVKLKEKSIENESIDIPHINWRHIEFNQKKDDITKVVEKDDEFYFNPSMIFSISFFVKSKIFSFSYSIVKLFSISISMSISFSNFFAKSFSYFLKLFIL